MLNFSKLIEINLSKIREYNPKIVLEFEQLWILNAFLVGFLQMDSQITLNLN